MEWRNRRVVVIDDEAPMRWLLALMFRERGAEVFSAGDGRSGLQLVREQQPDLVILDILLPGMNGWETLHILRRTSDVPVVVLTAIGNGESEARCLDAGADDHVVKPFNRDVLLARCWSAVRRYPVSETMAGLPDRWQKSAAGPAATSDSKSMGRERIQVGKLLSWRAAS